MSALCISVITTINAAPSTISFVNILLRWDVKSIPSSFMTRSASTLAGAPFIAKTPAEPLAQPERSPNRWRSRYSAIGLRHTLPVQTNTTSLDGAVIKNKTLRRRTPYGQLV